MRIGFIGPASGDSTTLRVAAECILTDERVDQIVYLGNDDAIVQMASTWAQEIRAAGELVCPPKAEEHTTDEESFLSQAAILAQKGNAESIEALLQADAQLHRLSALRTLPPPPARAVEIVDHRVLLMMYDKAILDEDDIANASVIVYGKSDDVVFRRFGPRYFFSPGPLKHRKVGVIELESDGNLAVTLSDLAGTQVWREILQSAPLKITVA